MATKKQKPSQSGPLAEEAALELSTEDAALLAEARQIIARVRQRMHAVVRAASEQWHPAVDPHQVDETAEPYLSDEEFDDITNVTELMAEMAFLREVGLFFGMPQPMVDSVVQDRLRMKLIPSHVPKGPIAFVAKKKGKQE